MAFTGWVAVDFSRLDARGMHALQALKGGPESGPFFVFEAREIGLTWKALQNKRWIRVSRGQYVSSRLPRDIRMTLHAVAQRMPPMFAFSGKTAAWLLGLDMSPCEPVEVTLDRAVPVRARVGVRLRRASLAESEVAIRNGFRTTCALRTVRDLASSRDAVESVVAIDMAVRAGVVKLQDLAAYVVTHPGEKGIKRLRHATALADPRSESPMETRLRVALTKTGLPRPEVQTELRDLSGHLLGRADLYYPGGRLVVEYDGENHRDRLVTDMRRQNAIVNAGYQVLRFTAADLRSPASIVAQVRHALAHGRQIGR